MLLLERDGPICQGDNCKHVFTSMSDMRVDEKDGSEHHNCISNKQLLCHSCNIKKGLEQKKAREANPELDASWLQSSYPSSRQTYVLMRAGTPENGNGHADADKQASAEEQKQEDADLDEVVTVPYDNIFGTRKVTRRELKEEQEARERLEEEKEYAALTPTMRKNKKCEKPFNDWLDACLRRGMQYDYETWKNAGANEFECGPDTIAKYLNKRTNPINGDLEPHSDGQRVYLDFKDKHEQ